MGVFVSVFFGLSLFIYCTAQQLQTTSFLLPVFLPTDLVGRIGGDYAVVASRHGSSNFVVIDARNYTIKVNRSSSESFGLMVSQNNLYIAGGYNGDDVVSQIFSFGLPALLPQLYNNLISPRQSATVAELGNYVIIHGGSTNFDTINSIEVFTNGKKFKTHSMHHGKAFPSTLSTKNTLIFAGGEIRTHSCSNQIEIFQLSLTNTYTFEQSKTLLPIGRCQMEAVVIKNKGFLLGGMEGDFGLAYSKKMHILHFDTMSWDFQLNVPFANSMFGVCGVGDYLIALGGFIMGESPLIHGLRSIPPFGPPPQKTVYVAKYDTLEWSLANFSLSEPRSHILALSSPTLNKCIAAGGYRNFDNRIPSVACDVIYDPTIPTSPPGPSSSVSDPPSPSNSGAIAAAIIVTLIITAIIILVIVIFIRRRKQQKQQKPTELSVQAMEREGSTTYSVINLTTKYKDLVITDVKIGRKIAQGNFSEVFIGTYNNKPCCLKKLKSFDEDIFGEAQLLSALSHPHIITCLGLYCPDDKTTYLVTEYMNQGDLWSFLLSSEIKLTEHQKRIL
jgi:hypothetical protein